MRARIADCFRAVAWVAVAVIALHVVDDAWWAARPGTSAGHNLVLGLPAVLLAVAWALVAERARPGARAWLAFVMGGVMIGDAGSHVVHAQDSGVGSSDVTGFLVGLTGIALVGVAVAIAARPKAPRSRPRRWSAWAGAVVGTIATALFVIVPIYLAVYASHKPAMDVPQASLPPGHRDFTLRTADGVTLAASYVPPRNGAAVILVHGSGGDRGGGIASRARMLVRRGYGVLVYDARGSGESSGRPENLGWTWPRDVKAVTDWLSKRPEIAAGRIGALGLSTGAEVSLTAAAQDKRIAAVVAEGTESRTVTEGLLLPFSFLKLNVVENYALATPLYRAFTHAPSPPSLGDLIPSIGPRPVLLIASDEGYEPAITKVYKDRSGSSVQRWVMKDTPHTGGLATHPREYERRVVEFFDRALLARH